MKGFLARRAVFFLLVGLKSRKRLMVWLGAFIWVLAHKEKDADITSKTKSQPKQKGFRGFLLSTKLKKSRFLLSTNSSTNKLINLKTEQNEKRNLEIYHSDDSSYSDCYSDQPGRYQLHELRAGLRAPL